MTTIKIGDRVRSLDKNDVTYGHEGVVIDVNPYMVDFDASVAVDGYDHEVGDTVYCNARVVMNAALVTPKAPKADTELDAVITVIRALEPLAEEDQLRVLAAVTAFLSIDC
jgi:hypothetical protein